MTVENKEITIEQTPNTEKAEVKNTATEAPKIDDQEKKTADAAPEDPNWRAFREARKKDRLEKEAAERRAAEKEQEVAALKAAMEAAFAKENYKIPQGQSRDNSSGFDDDETEDQRIDRKVQAALAIKEQQYKKEQQQIEKQQYPQRLTQTYHDFHATVNEETLDYLEYHYPEIARPLKKQEEGYDKWSDIYLTVKKLVPNATNHKKDSLRADVNAVKPKSLSSTGLTQNTQNSHYLTDSQKAANWERMQRTLKGLS